MTRRILLFALVSLCFAALAFGASQGLTWDASVSPGVNGYNVYRSTTHGHGYVKLNTAPITGLTYTDSTVAEGLTYYYVATAVRGSDESGYSNELAVQIPYTSPLLPPGNFRATEQVAMDWNPVERAEKYVIYRQTAWHRPWQRLGETTGLRFIDEDPVLPASYWVRAQAGDEQSAPATLTLGTVEPPKPGSGRRGAPRIRPTAPHRP